MALDPDALAPRAFRGPGLWWRWHMPASEAGPRRRSDDSHLQLARRGIHPAPEL